MSFYSNPDHAQRLVEAARRWDGTPFVARARVCGSGADCVNLALALYAESGLELDCPLPEYGLFDGACRPAGDAGPIIAWLKTNPRFRLTWQPGDEQPPAPAIGDLLCINIANIVHHLGIAIDERLFIHSLRGYGVMRSSFYDPTYLKRLAAIYRPHEHEEHTQHLHHQNSSRPTAEDGP